MLLTVRFEKNSRFGWTVTTGKVDVRDMRRNFSPRSGLPSAETMERMDSGMKIQTTRFGAIQIEPDDILFFRSGLLGFEDCRHWVLLADADNEAVAWLQSMQHSDIALPVVSPAETTTNAWFLR